MPEPTDSSDRAGAAADRRGLAAATMRARLIEAAIGQLAHEGMRGLTHRRVEQRAGVSQGLVKYHFGSLDGLIEAVVDHMADIEIRAVMRVTPEQHAQAAATGQVPPAVWQAAREAWAAVIAQPELVRARFELYLHAGRHPGLQAAIRRGRERFVDAAAASLSSAEPRAGARMVLALVTGLLLHQVSAPDETVDEWAPAYLLASGFAASLLPDSPEG
ncbi:TetR/AcrR family transcriptional regulator [Granulicoccus sp. GXG6511]|uniref:TetR/AcrR family transcriptional regulator n=1 Tax=Granulicoccus sp. GXG6511 TaxID=3381351 RepID=UPI003D7E69D1